MIRRAFITDTSRWHRQVPLHLGPPDDRPEDEVPTENREEYQDGTTPGSLANARRCWLDLSTTGSLLTSQKFTFLFQCPTERMAIGLTDFLRYTDYAGYVRIIDRVGIPRNQRWQVMGTTRPEIWSLSSLEHLFMRLRGAGSRYVAALLNLDRATHE
jgi:hypothetical protein